MEIPESRTMGGLLAEQAQRYADRPAIVFEDQTWTYAEFDAKVSAIAKGLLALGVKRGEHIALLAGNRPEWLFVCFAAARIGAVLCPLNTWHKRDELDYGIHHSDAVALLLVGSFLQRDYTEDITALMPELGSGAPFARYPLLRDVIMLDDGTLAGASTLSALIERGRTIDDEQLAAAAAAVEPTDLCYVLYTSGSTATPKAVMLRHYGVIENDFQIGERQHLTPDDRLWLVLPLFYALASANGMPAIYTHGGCVVLQEHFDAGAALELIERERCTVYYGLANITHALLTHPDFESRDVSSLDKGVTGFTPEDKRMVIETLGVEHCCAIYGLTESYGNCAVTDASEPLDVRLHTQGMPLPNWEFKIVDPVTLEPVAQGEVGLVLIRGYTTPGYYKDEQGTADTFDPDGFFITGDLGRIDASGRFRFDARLKDMIKTGGINVSPVEVEHLLQSHPLIRQAHVLGVADSIRDELIVAFVEPAADLSEDEVKSYVKQRAASFKVPRHVFFRTEAELPRLASGKVARSELRAWAEKELATHGAEMT